MPRAEAPLRPTPETSVRTSFLIVDTETVPDGELLRQVKYPDENLTPAGAIEKARSEARENSYTGSDFIPYTFQIPVSVCVARVGADFSLQAIACLDAPHFRTVEIVKKFWQGVSFYTGSKLVTFNGRTFDLPMLELQAFRQGLTAKEYFYKGRNRYNGDIDLMDFMTNFGAARLNGGLDLLAKLIGKPGKMETSGSQVYDLYLKGHLHEINDYCMFDTLDTYFVFLRTRVLTGDLTLDQEKELVDKAKKKLLSLILDVPALKIYLDHWSPQGDE